jgi:TetR/AcrR family acrAB operon transcriptional repressor
MQDRSVVTINNILEATRDLFIEKQYADVTLKEIAKTAGVTKGALYHHFATKEDLYISMMHHYLDEIKESTQGNIQNSRGLSCRERLYLSLLNFLKLPNYALKVVALVRRDNNLFKDPTRAELIQAYQAAIPDPVETILADGMSNGEIITADARLLAWQYIALVEVSIHPYGYKILGEPESMADFVVTTIFSGIEAK